MKPVRKEIYSKHIQRLVDLNSFLGMGELPEVAAASLNGQVGIEGHDIIFIFSHIFSHFHLFFFFCVHDIRSKMDTRIIVNCTKHAKRLHTYSVDRSPHGMP